MDFTILASKFRTLEHSILGLLKNDKTNEELKEEFLELEKKIKAEVRRDGALPQGIVQNLLDDFQRVRDVLQIGATSVLDKIEEVAEEVKEKIEDVADAIEEKVEETVEAIEEKIETVTEAIEAVETKVTKKGKK